MRCLDVTCYSHHGRNWERLTKGRLREDVVAAFRPEVVLNRIGNLSLFLALHEKQGIEDGTREQTQLSTREIRNSV